MHYSVPVVIDWPGTVIAINVGGALMSQPSINYSNQGRIVNLIHFVGVNLLEPVNHAPGRYGSKGAAVKNATISPVIDCAGIVGFVVEYMPKEPLINLRTMAHFAFDSRATVWTGS